MCNFCLFYWGDLVLLQSVQRIVNNYLLNSCCRLTFISLHNLPYDYCLMCVCGFYFCLRFTFFLARDSLFLISYRFSFFSCIQIYVFLFSYRYFSSFIPSTIYRANWSLHFFIASFPRQTNEKESPRVKLEKKSYKKNQLHGISIIK